jgi:hypothetical protein
MIRAISIPILPPFPFCAQLEGSGEQEGMVFFIPNGVDIEKGTKGVDYFDQINDVVEYVVSQPSFAESRAAALFLPGTKRVDGAIPRRRGRPQRNPVPRGSPGYDLSWKEGGSSYPKLSSRVGEDYQATYLPPAGTFQKEGAHETDSDL